MYSNREGYDSFSNRNRRAVPNYQCATCVRTRDELTFVSQLQSKSCDVFFIKEKVYAKKPNWKKKVQIRIKTNRLYKLQLESPMTLIGSDGDKHLNEQWHRRMRHLHHGALRILRKTVTGVPNLSTKRDDVCRGCALGKYPKATFPRSKNKAKSVLGLIH